MNDAKARVKEIDIDAYRKRCASGWIPTLIDVREESEWNNGRLPGAVHLSKGVIERDIESQIPKKETEMVLYCGGGFRSALAADALQKMGYTNVYSLDGGWRVWKEKDLPVEK